MFNTKVSELFGIKQHIARNKKTYPLEFAQKKFTLLPAPSSTPPTNNAAQNTGYLPSPGGYLKNTKGDPGRQGEIVFLRVCPGCGDTKKEFYNPLFHRRANTEIHVPAKNQQRRSTF